MPLEIFSKIFTWIALGFVVLALLSAIYTGVFLLNSEGTEAKVVDVKEVVNTIPFTDPSAGKFYYPILFFTAKDGKEYRIQGSVPSLGGWQGTGTVQQILYDKNNPTLGRINTFLEIWAQVLLWLALAGLFGIFIAAIKGRPDKSSGISNEKVGTASRDLSLK